MTPRSVADHPSTRSPNRRSAPAASARRRCSRTVRSGRTKPLRSSKSPTVSSAGANIGNRARIPEASSISCGSPCCCALASEPATVSEEAVPTISPPVRVRMPGEVSSRSAYSS